MEIPLKEQDRIRHLIYSEISMGNWKSEIRYEDYFIKYISFFGWVRGSIYGLEGKICDIRGKYPFEDIKFKK